MRSHPAMTSPGRSSTRISVLLDAPRQRVYHALIDAQAVREWMVPDGMTSRIHQYDAREGGVFRISLTYEDSSGSGKTTSHTDTYHGRFVTLVPGSRVVQTLEFETDDPSMQGEMTTSFTLRDAGNRTELVACHDDVPPGISADDNETGWRMSLQKLARLLQSRQ
jgi:uncharacterized protein YndB with AHSA1/START domain